MKFLGTLLLTTFIVFSTQANNKLEKNMKNIDKNFKAISKQISKVDKKEDSLKRIDTILESIQIAKEETPTTIEKMPTEKQPEAQTKYKDYLEKLTEKTNELKVAISSDNADQSKALFKDIDQLKKEAHNDFKKKKKK